MNHYWYSVVFAVSKLIVTWRWAWAFGLWKHWVSKTLCGINLAQSCLTVLNLLTVYHSIGNHKVLSLLCRSLFWFDLVTLPSVKIQIMGGKITENLGFESPLRKVKNSFVIFLFIFKFSIKNCISLFLTIFEYLVLQIKHFQYVLFDF